MQGPIDNQIASDFSKRCKINLLTCEDTLELEKVIPSFFNWLYKLGIKDSWGSPLKSPSAHERNIAFNFSCTLDFDG